ncbi:MAG: hypothetical protein U9Q76_05025 [candidate division WOR-3 bacterium]|nr:hypothetical protein [candidate division WOR-3 bacterium]
MTRSGIQPKTVKLWRIKDGQLDVTVAWDIHQVTVEDDQGSHKEWEYKDLRFEIPYTGNRPEAYLAKHKREILLKAKTRLGDVTTEEAIQLDDLRDSVIYARIKNIDSGRTDKKYVQVTRTIEGQELTTQCFVTYSMLQAYKAGDLAQGDYVIIEFADGDLNKPIVMDKVIGF